LDDLTWTRPPEFNLSGNALVPSSSQSNWWATLQSNLHVTGDVKVDEFNIKKTQFRAAEGRFSWSSANLEVPSIRLLASPDGGLTLKYSEDAASDQFMLSISSTADPKFLHYFLDCDS